MAILPIFAIREEVVIHMRVEGSDRGKKGRNVESV